MLSVIIGLVALIIILLISYISYINFYSIRKDYDNTFLNITDQVNSTQFTEFQYDQIKHSKLGDLKSEVNNIKKNYITKQDAATKLTTKELQVGDITLSGDKELKINDKLDIDNLNTKNTNTNNLNATNATITNLNITGSINANKVNSTLVGSDRYGIGQFDDKTRVYSDNIVSLSLKKPNNTFDDIILVNNKSTNIAGQVRIKHNQNIDSAGISVYGGVIGGPDNWSYLPHPDGNTYIRPGRKNGDIFLDQANKINLKSKTVNVPNTLCLNNKCVDQRTFNTVSTDMKNLQQVCFGNSCISSSDINNYDSYKTNVQSLKQQVQTLQSQLLQIQSKFDDANLPEDAIINCTVSDWSDWSPCDKTCGTGQQTRNRTITKQPANGGTACPVLQEPKSCNTQACPGDCMISDWSGWSTCDKSCGTGSQTRTRSITKQAVGNGKVCPVLQESQTCNTQTCQYLYQFKNHTFTNAGATGRNGPTLAQCRSAYSAISWAQDTKYFNMSIQGIQLWPVPANGSYTIEAAGARGCTATGLLPGNGAKMQGTFNLIQGEILAIVVGQIGTISNSGSGGGGSGVIKSPYNKNESILVIAGGGGGAGMTGNRNGGHGLTTTQAGGNMIQGATNGNGGAKGWTSGDCGWSGGGGGFLTSGYGFDNGNDGGNPGIRGNPGGGSSFINNCTGGKEGGCNYKNEGGFGCGGGGSGAYGGGGGGGYSGGDGSQYTGSGNTGTYGSSGGGGGSYNSGTNQNNVSGANNGPGYVTITANF